MGNVYTIHMSDGRTAAVLVSRHGTADFRATVVMPHIPLNGGDTLAQCIAATRDSTLLQSMGTESSAVAEAVCYVASELAMVSHVREVLRDGELPRDALIAPSGAEALASARALYTARQNCADEKARGDELHRALEDARESLSLAGKLCASLAKQRDEREQFIATLTRGTRS
jgi:hypothetical protein